MNPSLIDATLVDIPLPLLRQKLVDKSLYCIKLTAKEAVVVLGARFDAGTRFTMDKNLDLIEVSSW